MLPEFSPIPSTSPPAQPPDPPPPPLPPENKQPIDKHSTINSEYDPSPNPKQVCYDQHLPTNRHPTINQERNDYNTKAVLNGKVDPQQEGNHQADPLLQSYKAKLLNESKHVCFPTWFESITRFTTNKT